MPEGEHNPELTETQIIIQTEMKGAFKRIKELSGLTLTNLEKIDVRKRIEFILKTCTAEKLENRPAPGLEAAVWFLKDNYAYDPMDRSQHKFLSDIDRAKLVDGARWKTSWELFKKMQEDQNKP